MSNKIYNVVRNESINIEETHKEEIFTLEIETPEMLIPFSEKTIDTYYLSDLKSDCQEFIDNLPVEIKIYFKIIQLHNDIQYTAFLDILGFSEYIKENIKNDFDAEDFSKNLQEIILFLDDMRNDNYNMLQDINPNNLKVNYTWVSDTFVFTIECKEVIEEDINLLKSHMILLLSSMISVIHYYVVTKFGLLVRGGISSKYSCLTNNLILGEGISESAKLEKDIAIYPRVIFQQDLISETLFSKHLKHTPSIAKDCDGYFFVDYLSLLQIIPPMIGKEYKSELEKGLPYQKKKILKKYQEIIKNGLSSPNDKIKSKYLWLDSYFKHITSVEAYKINILSEDLKFIK